MIDHTLLKPDCTIDNIKVLCKEAVTFGFPAVCVPPYFVRDAVRLLQDNSVKVATVIGFPYGYSATPAKVEEIKRAIDEEVDELDVVVNLCAIKEGKWNFVKNDIESMTLATHSRGKVIKVIFETSLLSEEQILKLCNICSALKVNYVKTSTGVNGGGATLDVVRFLRQQLPNDIKIKASGGIRSAEQAKAFAEAGADRIGTSSGTTIAGVLPSEA
jgi:deoxyribose-phosphate aldolase